MLQFISKNKNRLLFSLCVIIVAIVAAQINIDSAATLAMSLPVGFGPLKQACGSENMGGFKNRLLFYPACAVSAVPELADDPATALDLVKAVGSFTFITPEDKPIFIYATDKTVKYAAESQGDLDGKSYKIDIEFFHPGMKTEAAALARVINNTPGYLVLENPEGKQFLVGQPGLYCYVSSSFDGGQNRSDRRGFKFTATADSFCPFIELATPIDIDAIAL